MPTEVEKIARVCNQKFTWDRLKSNPAIFTLE